MKAKTADYCTPNGALDHKARIEKYWRDRGFDLEVKLQHAGFNSAVRSARDDTRSDMVNGFPQRRQTG